MDDNDHFSDLSLIDILGSGERIIRIRSKPSGRYNLFKQLWSLELKDNLLGKTWLNDLVKNNSLSNSDKEHEVLDSSISRAPSNNDPGHDHSRSINDSYCQIDLPFANSEELRNDYLSIYGGLRLGKILEDMDVLAATVAYLHCGKTDKKLTIVTAAVDRIDILSKDAFTKIENITLRAVATNVGNSSIEVSIIVVEKTKDDKNENLKLFSLLNDSSIFKPAAIARFIMVARSADGSSAIKIPKLTASDQCEKILLERGEMRRNNRLIREKQSIWHGSPTLEESRLIHEMFLSQKHGVAIRSTIKKFTQLCHPQVFLSILYYKERNIHNFIFGGFLMREAFELSYLTVMLHCRSHNVHLISMDELAFKHPVPIGSVLEYKAQITYTEIIKQEIELILHVEVAADVIDPVSLNRKTTNTFYYIYKCTEFSSKTATDLHVYPESYHDGMLYIEAKRRVQMSLEKIQINCRLNSTFIDYI